ncbi:VanW family protein [Candidatus Uhrbacteria bacterium]|nr:VanW family protein [Candidatus Uhrbacteria bacterium]
MKRTLIGLVITVLILMVLAADLTFSYQTFYSGRFYKGVHIGRLDVSGLTPAEALSLLNSQASAFLSDGLPFYYHDQTISLKPTVSATGDIDLSYDLFSFDLDATIQSAFGYARNAPWPVRLEKQIVAFFKTQTYPIQYALDQSALEDSLKTNFGNFEVMPVNARLAIKEDTQGLNVKIYPNKSGSVFDYQDAASQANDRLSHLSYRPIKLRQMEKRADITLAQANDLVNVSGPAQFINLAPVTLVYEDKKWQLSRADLMNNLDFGWVNDSLTYVLAGSRFQNFLKALAKQVNQPAVQARFEMKDGKVSEFQVGKNGLKMDVEKNALVINLAINSLRNEAALEVDKVQAEVTVDNINDLGVKEIIGVGRSNFVGSPVNRRHNISVGAAKLNGVIIRPGEDFSLIKTLGEISGETGYKQELVIKGNKTTPEYGGGLCQIGTTTFRAALASGLPILERQNHSYRVPYYEPAGTDATIYYPKPDFRFLNDTGKYILIQTYMKGNDLWFEFWGTKDDRLVDQTKSRVYNLKAPPPKEIIETEDLAPGKVKCTERAHVGADAEFTYKVIYPGGEVKQTVFKSHYKPWGEVCLVGKKAAEETVPVAPSGEPSVTPQGTPPTLTQ